MRIVICALVLSMTAPLGASLAAQPDNAQARERLMPPAMSDSLRTPLPGDRLSQDQARFRLESDGYGGVSTLLRGADGAWTGKAQRNGQTMDVAVDADGNVTAR
jgi:hypothetical protein